MAFNKKIYDHLNNFYLIISSCEKKNQRFKEGIKLFTK